MGISAALGGIVSLFLLIICCHKCCTQYSAQNDNFRRSIQRQLAVDRVQTAVNVYPTRRLTQLNLPASSHPHFHANSSRQSNLQPQRNALMTSGTPQQRQTSLEELPPSYVELYLTTNKAYE
jgi:hypothetical protein